MAKPFVPKIVSGNALLTGDAVFMGRSGWSGDHTAARVGHTPDDVDALMTAAIKRAAFVVEPYLVDVTVDDAGVPQPLKTREAIRTSGPSVRPDLTVGHDVWLSFDSSQL